MAHRLLIVQPSYYRSKRDRKVFKVRRRPVAPLTTPYLAALTPPGWEIKLTDEQLEEIDFNDRADLVAITTWTLNSYRAYDIADEFRRRGRRVILGGPYAFFHAEEAGEHCDAVGIGEAERIWPQMLEDAVHGRLKPVYRAEVLPSLAGLPLPRYDLLNMRYYRPFTTFTVSSSRGCPFRCEFCSERFLLGEAYRRRPVDEVAREIKSCGGRNFLFGDSNFAGKRSHAMELMEALVPLRIRWSALWPSYLCDDAEFLDLACRSGLLHVNVGIESINPETLDGMNKRFNKRSRYDEMLSKLRARGISYSLNFIFGWDGEEEGAFEATLRFLHEHKTPAAYFNILTPVKGTPLYDRFVKEDRFINREEIDRWPGQLCHIKPNGRAPEQLERNVRETYRQFYSLGSMLRRLPMPWTRSAMASWVINFSQRRMAAAAANNFDGF